MIRFYKYQKPHPFPGIIQGVWWFVNDGFDAHFPLISDGYAELVFPLKGQFSGVVANEISVVDSPSIIGVSDRSIQMHAKANSVFVFVKLMPWALPLIINDTAKLLKNRGAALDNFHSLTLDYLEPYHNGKWGIEKVIESGIFPIITRILDKKSALHPLIAHHVSRLFEDVQQLSLESKPVNIQYSKRYLEKLYQENIGLSPMRYRRLIKMKKASLVLSTQNVDNLYSLAYSLGYYDQSHFHKDFLKIVNISPSDFAKSIPKQAILNNPDYTGQYEYS